MLNAPHTLEASSLSAALKIDLAVALGILSPEVAPIFRKINSIRNAFAHSSRGAFAEADARDFFNTWPPVIRKTAKMESFDLSDSPREVLAIGNPWALFHEKFK